MKRRILLICCLLVVSLLSTVAFTACKSEKINYVEPAEDEIVSVYDVVKTAFEGFAPPSASTDGSYTQSETTVYNGKTVYLAWKAVIDKTSGAKDSDVTVSEPVNGAVTIAVNMQSPVEFKYTLSFTLVNINGAEYKDAAGKPYTFSKDFIVPKYISAEEKVNAEKTAFEASFSSTATTLAIKGSTYDDVTISYSSSNSDVYAVATDGTVTVTPTLNDESIELIVTFTCGDASVTSKKQFTVPADNNLKLQKIIEGMTTTITDSITLPEGVTWSVKSGTAITITNGTATVTQPEFADGDATGVLTATLGEATKDVTITVKAKDQACYAYIINPQLLKAKFYLTGEMANTYYLATSTFLTNAVVVYKEALTEGYKFYYLDGSTKKYFAVEKNGNYYNVKFLEEGNVFYHNAELNYWYTTAGEDECFLGGSGEHNTGSSYAISNVGKSNYYYMQFVETTAETQISDEAIANAELNAITVTDTITGAGSIDLSSAAKVYGNDVNYVWTIETDALSIGTISGNNKLTVTNPASDTTVTLKVVVTYKNATDSKTFTVTVKHKDATSALQELSEYTLSFPDSNQNINKTSAYNKTWTATNASGKSWTIANFNNNNWNNWTYIKAGSKNNASIASISNTVSTTVKQIVITIDNVTTDNINEIYLQVSTSDDFANATKISLAKIEKGDKEFDIPTNIQAANLYYKLVFDCNKASKNGPIQISKVVYKG